METWAIVLIVLSAVFNIFTLVNYFVKVRFFNFYGNKYIPVVGAFILCLGFALFANFNPAAGEGTSLHPLVVVSSSIFDALKMMAVAFERAPINAFLSSSNGLMVAFGIGYIITSVFALIWLSFAAIVLTLRGIKAVTCTSFKRAKRNKDAYYIFSDPKVTIAARLGESLKNDGHAVTMVLTRGSQKTQDGTEYRSMLVSKGFEVKVENYSKGLGLILLGKHFNTRFHLIGRLIYRWFNKHKIYVLGLFSDDEESLKTANTFKQAIESNRHFKRIKKKFAYFKLVKKLDDINPNNQKDINHLNDDDFATISRFLCKKKRPASLEDFKNNFNNYYEVLKSKKRTKRYRITDYDLAALNAFKVYLTYHGPDIDLTNHYSDNTLHMVNALSEYDMVSSEFMLANQIDKFIDINKLLEAKPEEDNQSLHVTFFGLGKVNRPILKKMTYAYQLWKDNKDKVTYHIVDQDSENAVKYFQSDYTEKNSNPLLYRIIPEENGNDIRSFSAISRYIEEIYKDKKRFQKDGFEIFVISVVDTSTDIEIALSLRKALFKHCKNIDKLRKTVIFVRISTPEIADNFIQGNSSFAMKQSQFDEYDLLNNDKKEEDKLVPVVVFGENALMSDYLANHYKKIESVGISAVQSYNGCDKKEAVIRSLMMDKKETISNSETIYCLRPKLKLLHCDLNKDFKIVLNEGSKKYHPLFEDNTSFKEMEFYTNPDERIKALVALEHNRWTAVSSIVDFYGVWDVDSFKKTIKPYTNKKGKQKVKWSTKDPNKSKHICMLTCKDLYDLEDTLSKDKDMITLFNKEGYPISVLKDKLHQLVYGNDLDTMNKVFSALNEKKA